MSTYDEEALKKAKRLYPGSGYEYYLIDIENL
jgi:hypothetical protein